MPVRSTVARSAVAAIITLAGSATALGAGPFGIAINLGSLNGTNGFVVNGFAENDFSGNSVASAGDVNGDGIDDLIIGAFLADPSGKTNAGRSYVVFGNATGFAPSLNLSTLNGTNGFVIDGIDANDQTGRSVSSAGDVNGDGYDDLIIGAPYGDPNGQSNAGECYVVFGKATGFAPSFNPATLNGTNGFVINCIAAGDQSGRSVSSAGDVNGDGYDDLIIGARYADPNGQGSAGESYIVFGGPGVGATGSLNLSSLNGVNGFILKGTDVGDQSGRSVSSAGDVNGDGYGDLIIGAPYGDPNGQSNAGESYVVFGKATGFPATINLSTLNGANGFVINGIDASDFAGFSVSSAGDVNGDGYDDLIIGAMGGDPNGESFAGESFVVFGGPGVGASGVLNLSTLNGANGFVINGIKANDRSGECVSSAGDVNGDGYDDMIIGAPLADPGGRSSAGESYVIFGGPNLGSTGSINLSTLNGITGFAALGIAAIDYSGRSVSSAGDINGDGIDDLVIGASSARANGISNAGQSYVIFGRLGQVWTSLSGGAWTTGSRWLSGVAPTAGTVVIHPQFGVTVTGPNGAANLKHLTLGAQFGRTTLDLLSSSVVIVEDPFTIDTSAALAGSGIFAVSGIMVNTGLIASDVLTMVATEKFSNSGLIDIAPASATGPAAILDLYGPCTNASAGDILLRSGPVELGVWDGLLNSGHLDIVLADATIFGNITNTSAPAGAIDIIAGSTALFTGNITNNSAIVLDADSSLTILGVLTGNGVSGPGGAGTAGPVFLGGGVSPGAPRGIAAFDGDATLGATAVTAIEIAGTVPGASVGGHDQVAVAGVLSAAGTLRITTIGSYQPLPGHEYKILDFGSVIGSFTSIQLASALVKANADTSTLLIDGTIRIPTPSCVGDINGDGSTNALDFNILAGNFGSGPGATQAQGDLNTDGFVNALDFNLLAGDFGCGP